VCDNTNMTIKDLVNLEKLNNKSKPQNNKSHQYLNNNNNNNDNLNTSSNNNNDSNNQSNNYVSISDIAAKANQT